MEDSQRPDTRRFITLVCERFRLAYLQARERKADKHLARQDDVLVRAVSRVWKARERGKLLERVRALRLVKGAWAVWREQMRQHRQLEGKVKCVVMTRVILITSRLCTCLQHAIQFIDTVVRFGNLAPSLCHLSEPPNLCDSTSPCTNPIRRTFEVETPTACEPEASQARENR